MTHGLAGRQRQSLALPDGAIQLELIKHFPAVLGHERGISTRTTVAHGDLVVGHPRSVEASAPSFDALGALIEGLRSTFAAIEDQVGTEGALGAALATLSPGYPPVVMQDGEHTVFCFQSLQLKLHGREAIEQFMVERARPSEYARRRSRWSSAELRGLAQPNLVDRSEGAASFPVVAVFHFDGDRVSGVWGFAGRCHQLGATRTCSSRQVRAVDDFGPTARNRAPA